MALLKGFVWQGGFLRQGRSIDSPSGILFSAELSAGGIRVSGLCEPTSPGFDDMYLGATGVRVALNLVSPVGMYAHESSAARGYVIKGSSKKARIRQFHLTGGRVCLPMILTMTT